MSELSQADAEEGQEGWESREGEQQSEVSRPGGREHPAWKNWAKPRPATHWCGASRLLRQGPGPRGGSGGRPLCLLAPLSCLGSVCVPRHPCCVPHPQTTHAASETRVSLTHWRKNACVRF